MGRQVISAALAVLVRSSPVRRLVQRRVAAMYRRLSVLRDMMDAERRGWTAGGEDERVHREAAALRARIDRLEAALEAKAKAGNQQSFAGLVSAPPLPIVRRRIPN